MALPSTSGTLIANFDAGTIGQSDNTAVSSWSPAAGAESAASTQATGAKQPTFRTNKINGLPAVVFTTAAQSCMDTGAWGTSYAIPNVAFTVAKLTNTADANFYSGRTPNFDYMGETSSGTNIAIGAGTPAEMLYGFTPGSAYHLYTAVYNGASSAIYIDSPYAPATGTTGSGSSSNMPGLRFGSNSAGTTNFPDMELAEFAFYHGALTAGDIFIVQSYLAAKYGLVLPNLELVRKHQPQSVVPRRRAATW